MSYNKKPVDKRDRKTNRVNKRANQTITGIGGGLVGAAVGGLLGRRVGGVFGGVVGTVAGALVGRATAVRVNYTIESMVDAAKTVADAVDHNVNSVGNAVKDTIETVKPTVVSIVDAVKDTVDEIKPSVVSTVETAKDTVEAIKPSILSIVDTFRDTVEELKPSVVDAVKNVAEEVNDTIKDVGNAYRDTVEPVKPSVVGGEQATKSTVESVKIPVADAVESIPEEVNYIVKDSPNVLEDVVDEVKLKSDCPRGTGLKPDRNTMLSEEQLVKVELLKSIPENPLEIKNIQQRQEEFKHQSEPAEQPKKQRIQLQTEKISKISGVIVLGVAFLTWMGVTLGFSSKQKQLVTKLPEYNQTINLFPEPTREATADGWIFIGTVNNASALGSKSFIEGSQSTDSPVVPIVGSIVTVRVRPGVILRKNRPQEPNFNYQEQNALTILKPKEKLKILQVEFVAHDRNTQAATKVWAEVHRCSKDCHYEIYK